MKKAIKFFEEEITRLENAPKINGCEMTDKWAEQIEICKTAKSAIEKQIPKKTIKYDLSYSGYKCPACDSNLYRLRSHNVYKTPCCIFCGQALDWSDTE